MNCTSCQSDNTQRLQIIYDAGTQHISTTSQSYGTSSQAGPNVVTTSTSGTATSQLAQKCSPPARASMNTAVTIIAISVFVYLFVRSQMWSFIAVGATLYAIFLIKKARAYNAVVWPPLYETWKRSWHCNRCGSIYPA